MIWCVEDDPAIRDVELYALESAGYEAVGLETGAVVLQRLEQQRPRLILLDVMLPGMDGVELLKKLKSMPKAREIPVIMATAKGSEYDKIRCLDLGADDYLVKPFGMMEMISRVKAVLRRCNPEKENKILRVGGLELDPEARCVYADGNRVTLTLKEYELLKLFLSHPNVAYGREELYSLIWGSEFIGETRTVDMHIRTLRQKLGDCGSMIGTVRGVGYILEEKHEP
ncbi:MAG: response regulator transcription factor [Oscillospiraceae bacterium]|nr:response regulator transcription factor [Oscillospiraceae bacterium]